MPTCSRIWLRSSLHEESCAVLEALLPTVVSKFPEIMCKDVGEELLDRAIRCSKRLAKSVALSRSQFFVLVSIPLSFGVADHL